MDHLVCCDNQKEVMSKGIAYCENCFADLSSIEFDQNFIGCRDSSNTRFKKFEIFVGSKALPWYLKTTLIDFFPKIEKQFIATTTRINFINLDQLCHSVLNAIGETEFLHLFKTLKTKTRIKSIDLFVSSLFQKTDQPIKLTTLRDYEFVVCAPLIEIANEWKVPKNSHIYLG